MTPSRKAAAAKALRTGLAWRGGRPRWEPSPSSRKAGLKGRDLKRIDGTWMSHGEALDMAERRAGWAELIRDAKAGGPRQETAAEDLRKVLDRLPEPADDEARWRRALLQDLVDAAKALLGDAVDPAKALISRSERSLRALQAGYFADVEARRVQIAAETEKIYRRHAGRLLAKFGAATPAADVNRGKLVDWYHELVRTPGWSVANANQCMGATAALFAWATRQDPPWIAATPATKLRLEAADGRLVFWEVEDETCFVAWADANGYQDLADGITAMLWTGARPIDLCAASLPDLSGPAWRYVPIKTKRHRNEAMPALMPQVKARVERRKAQALTAIDAPFLVDPTNGRRHTSDSFGKRFAVARAEIVAAGIAPHGFLGKNVQDTRDTCITRLWEAEVPPSRMWSWTGHSQKSIERILRKHYLVLREAGALAMAEKLTAWAVANGVAVEGKG